MRKLLILFFLAACQQIPIQGRAQTISLEVYDEPLEKVFSLVQRQSPYRFVYASEDLAATKKVTVSVQNASILTILEKVFKDQPVGYILRGQVIMISRNNKPVVPPSSAQLGIIVTGKVMDEQGNPLPGATVSLKSRTIITATDDKGNFILRDVDSASTVIVSSVGYEPKAFALLGRKFIIIQLSLSVNTLDETIIKGYYSTSKRLNTGTVSKITSETISRQPVSDPIAALEGRVPGLFISQSSGAPGSAFTVQLRGKNSIASGLDPLYVVDGVPFISGTLTNPNFFQGADVAKSPFNSINPSDIESIEILKDADATAIYGSRGANGVVLITTKKGVPGKNNVDVNFYSGYGKITRKMDLLNTPQYLQMRREAFSNDGIIPNTNTGRDLLLWDTSRYTDWQKTFIGGTASIADAQISMSGGNSNTQYMIGSGFHRETTVYPGDSKDTRGSAHISINSSSPNQKLKITFSASYSTDLNQLPQVDLLRYISLPPDAPALYDSTGKLNWQNSTWINPFSYLQQKFKATTDNLLSNLQLSCQLGKGFFIKTSLAYNNIELHQVVTTPLYSNNPAFISSFQAEADFAQNQVKTWIIEPQAGYHRSAGKNTFDFLAGGTFQQNKQTSTGQVATGFSNDALLENIQAAANVRIVSASATLYKYNGFFGRVNYAHDDKYLINLTGRRDGSSRFGPGKQFTNFGAAGIAWIFTKEEFLKSLLPVLSFGKLRSSYGITGNDQIGDYQFLSTYSPYDYQYFGVSGLYPNNLLNPSYGWETNKKLEFAIELGFFKNRVTLDVNYYRNRSSNQLVGYSLPSITGFTSIVANQPALIQNTGFEFEFTSLNIRQNNFSWNTSLNLTIPRNKLIAYSNLSGSSYNNRYAIGYPLSIVKLYHKLQTDPQIGIYQFEKQSDHSTTLSPKSPDDYIIKDMSVRYYGGLLNSLKYKSFSLDFLIQFVKQPGLNYFTQFAVPGSRNNQPAEVLSRWQHAGDNAPVQKFTQTGGPAFTGWANAAKSDFIVSDASFVRLKNISFSYQLPTNLSRKLKLQQARIFVQAQNLFTITKYKGLDPESGASLPPLKFITAGIHVII